MENERFALPWWDGDTVMTLREAIDKHATDVDSSPLLNCFKQSSFIVYAFLSNKLEGTLPLLVKEAETFQLLSTNLDLKKPVKLDLGKVPYQLWSAEPTGSGVSARASTAQLQQSVAALQYLLVDCRPGDKPLTVEMICTAHLLLMWGAVDDELVPLEAGAVRKNAAYSGTGLIYPAADGILASLEKIVMEYNAMLLEGSLPAERLAAQLMYNVIILHPFTSGNGRLCRMLATYVLSARGCPFPVPLSNGHTRARQHYQQCLVHADKHNGDVQRLACFVLECLHWKWCNYAIASKFK